MLRVLVLHELKKLDMFLRSITREFLRSKYSLPTLMSFLSLSFHPEVATCFNIMALYWSI